MVEWNPVAGLKEIAYEDLQVGDEVVQFSFNDTYRKTTIVNVKLHGSGNKYYLLHRPVVEPVGRGDLAVIYQASPNDDELEEVEVYVRIRPKYMDEDFVSDEAWTNTGNDVRTAWPDILDKLGEKDGLVLKTYTAMYKEN